MFTFARVLRNEITNNIPKIGLLQWFAMLVFFEFYRSYAVVQYLYSNFDENGLTARRRYV